MALSRNEILSKAGDRPVEDVPVPEWGEGSTIRLRCLSSADRLKFVIARDKAFAGEPAPEPSAYAVVLAAVDEHGNRIFQDQDTDALSEMRGDVIERLADKALSISAVSEQAVVDAVGNSDATTSGDSGSDSPETSGEPSPN